MKAMTASEFTAYWLAQTDDEPSRLYCFEESLAERVAQYHSECGLYGDAGPGQGAVIAEMRAELARVKSVLVKLNALSKGA